MQRLPKLLRLAVVLFAVSFAIGAFLYTPAAEATPGLCACYFNKEAVFSCWEPAFGDDPCYPFQECTGCL
jgi:hypothetical protein